MLKILNYKFVLRYSKIWTISLSLIISLIACKPRNSDIGQGTSEQKKGRIISVDPENVSGISFYELFSCVELIPLETNDNSLIKSVTKLISAGNKFYILDKDQGALFIFYKDGRYISKIQTLGRGPGEYTLLEDFTINEFNNNIELLNPRGEVLVYDTNGVFKERIRIPVRAIHYFANLSEALTVFYSQYEPNKLIYYSREEERIVKEEYQVPDFIVRETPLISSYSPFSTYNGKVTFFQGFTDTIYEFRDTNLSPRYIWDHGEYNLKINKIAMDKTIRYYTNFLRSSNFVYGYYCYGENDDYIITRFIHKNRWNFLFRSKKNNQNILVSKFQEKVNPPLFPVLSDNCMIAAVNPSEIQLLVNPSVLDEQNVLIYSNLVLEDNPVIIKYYFKGD